eukprot:6878071-Pyramimonas_sp.AAC.1
MSYLLFRLRTSARSGASNQTCRACMRPSSDVCMSFLKHTFDAHLDSGVKRRDECAWKKALGHRGEGDGK